MGEKETLEEKSKILGKIKNLDGEDKIKFAQELYENIGSKTWCSLYAKSYSQPNMEMAKIQTYKETFEKPIEKEIPREKSKKGNRHSLEGKAREKYNKMILENMDNEEWRMKYGGDSVYPKYEAMHEQTYREFQEKFLNIKQ